MSLDYDLVFELRLITNTDGQLLRVNRVGLYVLCDVALAPGTKTAYVGTAGPKAMVGHRRC